MMAAKLNDKQERFIDEYLVDLNATQAAIRAGYKEKTARQQGSRLLTNADIQARIEELQQERAKKVQLDAEWVLNRLKEISDKCMTAEPVEVWDHEARTMVETGEYQFDSTGANRATELIGKHLGMFKDKLDITGDLSMKIEVDYGDDEE
jgi:phage terminase small subunit